MIQDSRRVAGIGLVFVMASMAGCVESRYVGETFTRSSSVQIVYDAKDVPSELQQIGILSLQADESASSDAILKHVREEAMKRGADVVLVTSFGAGTGGGFIVGATPGQGGIISGNSDSSLGARFYRNVKNK